MSTTQHQTGLRVLVVDDKADGANSLAVLLRLAGHDAIVTTSAEEALELTEKRRFDVALVELRMPGINGFELGEKLRWRGIKLMALTTCGTDTDRRRAYEAGYTWHLLKPANPTDILLLLSATAKTTVKD